VAGSPPVIQEMGQGCRTEAKDHPDQLFIAQEDGETNAIDLAECGQNIDLIAGTLCAGNTDTGIGKMELNSDSAAT